MKKCVNYKCQRELRDDFKICPYCGTPVSKIIICPCCGEELPADARFCPKDGTKLQNETEWEGEHTQIKSGEGYLRKIIIRRNTSSFYDDWDLFCYKEQEFLPRFQICKLCTASEYYTYRLMEGGAFTLIVKVQKKKEEKRFYREINVPEDFEGEISLTGDWWNGFRIRLK